MMPSRTPGQGHVPMMGSRRDFLLRAGGGFGAVALSAMMQEGRPAGATGPAPAAGEGAAAGAVKQVDPLAPKAPHFKARAKSVIFLFMEGGPSHIDLFDPKPALDRLHGQPLPASFGKVVTAMNVGGNKLLASKRKWTKAGKSGIDVSDWYPHIAGVADDLCVLRSAWCDGINHVGSVCQMNTGSILAGRPSIGAWTVYGLGTENRDLPSFVVMTDAGEPLGGPRNYGTGFMPATYQGTMFRNGPNPILHLKPGAEGKGAAASDDPAARQRRKLDLLKTINEGHLADRREDTELAARIATYELAYRMQSAAPEAVDISREPPSVLEEYGVGRKECNDFAVRCLLARRLVERGVRFVQVYCGGGSQWDAHGKLEDNHGRLCARSDRPAAALIKDLKRRGLLDSTLVVWGGEFGRTPMTEGTDGRDHNPWGFTMCFAGGGVKAGTVVGSTDEIGLRAVEEKAHVHDLHATMLHLMGLNHKSLTYLYNGREERATENGGRIIRSMLA